MAPRPTREVTLESHRLGGPDLKGPPLSEPRPCTSPRRASRQAALWSTLHPRYQLALEGRASEGSSSSTGESGLTRFQRSSISFRRPRTSSSRDLS